MGLMSGVIWITVGARDGQMPQKHFESGGAFGQKGHFFIQPKSNNFMSFMSRTKIFENMESL